MAVPPPAATAFWTTAVMLGVLSRLSGVMKDRLGECTTGNVPPLIRLGMFGGVTGAKSMRLDGVASALDCPTTVSDGL